MLVGYSYGSWLFFRGAARYDGRERLAWTLLAWALAIGAIGLLVFNTAYLLGADIPAFGPLDVFFLVAYSLALAGMWVLPHLEGAPTRRARIFIDGLVGAISVGTVSWVWFLADVLEGIGDAPASQVLIGSAYPLIDIATLVVVIVVTLRRSTLRFDPRVLLLGAGFSAQAVADLIYLTRGIDQSFADADPVHPLLLLAVVAFMAAGVMLQNRPPAREYAERRTPWWAMVGPYGAAAVLAFMLVRRMRGEQLSVEVIELFVGVTLVIALIVIRQALAIRENRELVEQQRSALVSSISHELRTPLTAMVGFLDILSDPDQHMDAATRREMVGIVNQQATYMARIVSDLVMLNRSDPDVQLSERWIEVEAVVTSAVASLDIDSGPGVETRIDTGLSGYFDPNRIQQVLVNLLTNASRYGGPHRLVVAKAETDDLIIEVHDNGPGVARRFEIAIWDRFERGSHRYDATVPGTGIGLAIVAMLVNAHHGTTSYRRSELLGGACFVVSLPGRAHLGRTDEAQGRPPAFDRPDQLARPRR